jgi:monovalent cation/proton antiporter MnhG/PhaG subunit
MKDAIEAVLVVGGVAVVLLSCLGLATARDPYDRLHYLSAGSTAGTFLIAAGIVVEAGLDGVKALLVAAIFVVTGPALTHAIARAAHLAEQRAKGGKR